MKKEVFRYSRTITKGLKKVTNLFQIGLFPHKKSQICPFQHETDCNVKKKQFQCLVNVNVNFLIYMIEILYQLNTLIPKAKWRSL